MAGYGSFARFYDSFSDKEDYINRCNYISSLLDSCGVKGGIMLDLACGTGEMSFLLAEKGFDVIGVDASEEMLAVANEKNALSFVKVLFLLQRAGELDLFGTIGSAVCTFDSVNHITDPEELEKCFAKIGLFMEKGGVFIFDVNTSYKHSVILADNTFAGETDDMFFIWQNETDEDLTVHISLDMFVLEKDGRYERLSDEFDEVIYSEEYLKKILEQSGFEVIGIYDDLTRQSVRPDSERAVYVCRKVVETNAFYRGEE